MMGKQYNPWYNLYSSAREHRKLIQYEKSPGLIERLLDFEN